MTAGKQPSKVTRVPPGWTAVYGDADTPGSLVRVRSHRVPDPDVRGYAKTLIAATH